MARSTDPSWSLCRQLGRIEPAGLGRQEWFGVMLALALLLAPNAREALQVMQAFL